jgi:hypothetical protein
MADPTDPLNVLNADPKKLELIRKFFKEYLSSATGLTKELQAVGLELGFLAEKTSEAALAEAELRNMYKTRVDAAGNLNKILSVNKEIRDEELKVEQAALVQAEQSYIKAKERLALVEEEFNNKRKLRKKNLEEYRLQQDILYQKLAAHDITQKEFDVAMDKNKKQAMARHRYLGSLDQERTKLTQILTLSEQQIEDAEKEVEKQEKLNKGFDTSVSFLDGMIEKTGFFSEKWTTGPLGGIHDFIEAGGDLGKLFDELSLKLGKINLKNLSANVLTTIFEQTLMFLKQFDKLAADFRKNTGIIDRGFTGIEQRIVNVQRANLRMGVSMDEAFKAANSLTAEMASFTSMTDDAQATVLQAATVLQEFGVGAQTTAQIFNNFSKGLGYNADQLERLSTQLMGISTSLKIPPQIIATEFNAASKELMKYGDDMVDVFKGIAEQSKQTGIAMGELLGIVKQFDTFEGAGAAVGKLNAILGGPYLNAINMVYATEEERIKQLRQSIQLSGRQFNQLSRFEQQAIATAAGISDMTVAARLFGGTNSEFAKTQMSMKEMQERASRAQSVTEKFTQVMQSFAIALGPVVHLLGIVAQVLLFLLNPFGELARFLGADSEIVAGLGQFQILLYGVAAAMKYTGVAAGGLGAVLSKAFWPVTVAVGTFMALKKVLEMMTPILRVFAGIGLVIAGIVAIIAAIPTGGASLGAFSLLLGAAGAGSVVAGVGGFVSGVDEFGGGKDEGVSARGGMGVLAEPGSGPELLMKGNGGAYLVSTPSLVELNPQDTVYSNAETKAMLNGGGGNDSTAIAEMRQMIGELARSQQQQSAAADRRVEAMLDRPVVVSVNDKKLFETMKPQLNRALGLSRRGTLT